MSKIVFENNSNRTENGTSLEKNELTEKANLFHERTEAEKDNAKFPDWDIIPPNQFINPRIK